MAVAVMQDFTGGTLDQYDEVLAKAWGSSCAAPPPRDASSPLRRRPAEASRQAWVRRMPAELGSRQAAQPPSQP